ncbi:uncharacterized protein LOC124171590 [Ischnura elegans]|uniref:uncharacterized protein LOC124171590 n=1 Tax=Ischnura elegans TaxID=197161 RepID=UPI001ED86AA9|nr:uncharacterized protein LOC124171590 [Ischnura elegans]
MSESHKTLVRYPDGARINSRARSFPRSVPEQEEKAEVIAHVTSQRENALFSVSSGTTGRSESVKTGVSAQEYGVNEACRRLNIPFDEVVYQDLISLNDIGRKIKCDEFIGHDGKQRRLKKCDVEPDLFSYFRPTKKEFLFCDLLGKNLDVKGWERESSCYNLANTEREGKHSKECGDVADGESEKYSTNEEMDFENRNLDPCSEKVRLMHENYGLAPPQLKTHFEGFSLCERSLAWKLSGKPNSYPKSF